MKEGADGAGEASPRELVPGLVSVTFRQLSPVHIIRLAASAGLRAIEWGGDVHVPPGQHANALEVAHRTRDEGLQVAGYGTYYVAGAPGAEFGPVLETAVALGAPMIRVWAGRTGSRETDAPTRAMVTRDLVRIAEQARGCGIKIGLEFHEGTLTDTDESAGQLLNDTAHPNLYSYWQPRHGESTDRARASLRSVLPRLRTVHVFHWWPTPAQRHALSDGAERWSAFFSELRAPGSQCNVLLEFLPGDDPALLPRESGELLRLVARAPA